MQKYRAYPKQAIIAVMRGRRDLLGAAAQAKPQGTVTTFKKPSFWDVSKWPEYWTKGAEELEKTAPGRLITAPIRIPEAVVTSTKKTVEQIPETLKTVTKAIPIIAVSAVVLGAAFLLYKFSKGKASAAPSSEKMVL